MEPDVTSELDDSLSLPWDPVELDVFTSEPRCLAPQGREELEAWWDYLSARYRHAGFVLIPHSYLAELGRVVEDIPLPGGA